MSHVEAVTVRTMPVGSDTPVAAHGMKKEDAERATPRATAVRGVALEGVTAHRSALSTIASLLDDVRSAQPLVATATRRAVGGASRPPVFNRDATLSGVHGCERRAEPPCALRPAAANERGPGSVSRDPLDATRSAERLNAPTSEESVRRTAPLGVFDIVGVLEGVPDIVPVGVTLGVVELVPESLPLPVLLGVPLLDAVLDADAPGERVEVGEAVCEGVCDGVCVTERGDVGVGVPDAVLLKLTVGVPLPVDDKLEPSEGVGVGVDVGEDVGIERVELPEMVVEGVDESDGDGDGVNEGVVVGVCEAEGGRNELVDVAVDVSVAVVKAEEVEEPVAIMDLLSEAVAVGDTVKTALPVGMADERAVLDAVTLERAEDVSVAAAEVLIRDERDAVNVRDAAPVAEEDGDVVATDEVVGEADAPTLAVLDELTRGLNVLVVDAVLDKLTRGLSVLVVDSVGAPLPTELEEDVADNVAAPLERADAEGDLVGNLEKVLDEEDVAREDTRAEALEDLLVIALLDADVEPESLLDNEGEELAAALRDDVGDRDDNPDVDVDGVEDGLEVSDLLD